jgi:uncharacterized protein YbaR (Trm112 family)
MPMHGPALPLDLLCCPACGGALDEGRAELRCRSCEAAYTDVGGVPWLFADPAAALGEWRARIHAFLGDVDAQAARYRAALGDDVIRASTRSRLKLLSAACTDHARRLRAVLAPLLAEAPAAAQEVYRGLGVELPGGQALTSYYANLHRDWSWGAAENAATYRVLDEALGDRPSGRTLMLGVGAGRLAYDFHGRRRPDCLLAVDLNPLFLLAARCLYAGDALDLYEFPVAPRDLASHAVLRQLRAPAPVGPGLHLVFADATRPPFRPGAFDTVVTPWFVDIVDEDLAVFARRLNAWLRPGGCWVNSGSLAFSGADPAHRYSLEEVLEIVSDAGFGAVEPREDEVPYLASPASRHARRETIVTFTAVKEREAPAAGVQRAAPEWLARTDLPVPLLPEIAGRQLEMRVLAFVASLVDGRRSVQDIARVLAEKRMMTLQESEPAVLGFLARLHAESRASSRPPL